MRQYRYSVAPALAAQVRVGAAVAYPPLAGEATRITVADGAAHADDADSDDPPAPPPDDAPPPKAPRTPTIPSPLPVLGGVTDEMTAFGGDDTTGQQAPLPSLSTLVVDKLSDGSTPPSSPMAPPLHEPKITLKTMKAAPQPIDWDAAAKDATQSVYTPPRWIWILVGALGGIFLAMFTVYLLRH